MTKMAEKMSIPQSRRTGNVIPDEVAVPELHVEQRGRDEYVIVDEEGTAHSKVLSYLSMFAARQHARNAIAFLPSATLSPKMKALLKYRAPGE